MYSKNFTCKIRGAKIIDSVFHNEAVLFILPLMAETKDWEDDKFNEVFEDEIRLLSRRFKNDPSCTIEDLRGILNSLYIIEGNNMDGRGRVNEISLSASIAAYESFIEEKIMEKKAAEKTKYTHSTDKT